MSSYHTLCDENPCAVCPTLVGRMWEPGVERIILTRRCQGCIQRMRALGCRVSGVYAFIDAVSLEVPRILLPLLAQGKCAAAIEPDVRVQTTMDIATNSVGARLCNASGYTGRGIVMAIADTGIYPHADFTYPHSRIVRFIDLIGGRTTPYDDNGHGTFCAGCAAGSGGASQGRYAGVAPEAELVVIKAMDAAGGGMASDVLGAMQWVIDHHRAYRIRVFSLSLGAVVSGFMIDAMARGARRLWEEGVIVVAAAGNNGPRAGSITSPGTARDVITVGAVDDRTDALIVPDFSSRGPVFGAKKPDLVAPGVALNATQADIAYLSGAPQESGYTTMTGTSVACPIVAGCCALLLQAHPDWPPERVRQALLSSALAIDADENASGAGMIDIARALNLRAETA